MFSVADIRVSIGSAGAELPAFLPFVTAHATNFQIVRCRTRSSNSIELFLFMGARYIVQTAFPVVSALINCPTAGHNRRLQ
jgi:hypothetical protein